ncbi:GcrA family cell cycle regulator [Bradyrhizobium sp.]|jgi:GcrA cell cycle regulator|uniref:GcrA family cell cycle regulator n=1 Tax=Bradyrhizobium sp. TaxID=376 RepID=UPI002DDD8A5A|nr:GcrA family cell cycle regulator [Bradyrhizobium sp.]HEV2155436.1 GcrA family cell cycle regulator [Bradyrhizobium sp.]
MLKTIPHGNQYSVDGVTHERRGWSDEEIKFAREKWAAGWSASQISSQLNGRSRNSVISLIDRKGFTRAVHNTNQHARSVKPAAPYVRKTRGEKLKEQRAQRKLDRPVLHLPKEPKRSSLNGMHLIGAKPVVGDISRYEEPSDGVGVSLDELKNDMCRWPKGAPGEAGFVFCGCTGANFSAGKPYCAPHDRRAHE